MKRSLFLSVTIALLSVVSVGMSQNDGFLLDSVRETRAVGGGPYTKTRTHYYYNLYNQLKFDDVITNKNGFPDTADWHYTQKNYHFYDTEHRIIKDSLNSRTVNESDWSSIYKRDYFYSDTVNMQTTFSWDFSSGSWNNGNERHIDTLFPPDDFETSHLRQYWFDQTGQWENDHWVDTLFFSDGLTDIIKQTYWLVGDPTVHLSDSTLYDYTYYPDTLFTYQYENENGYYFLRKIYYSDDSSRKYNFKYRVIIDGTTDTLYRTIWYYDDQQRVIKYEPAWWHPDLHDWLITTTITYQYNDKGLLVQMDQYSGDHQQTKYSYNDDDLLWKKEYYPNAGDPSYFYADYYYYTYTYVGMQDQSSKQYQEMLLYPNPVKNRINFNELPFKEKFYRIVDVTGRLIQNGRLLKDEQRINVSTLTPGSYVITILADNRAYRGKFIKY